MKPILEITSISKEYTISHQARSYTSLRDSISGILKKKEESTESFFALKNVSFDIQQGESVGIIGRNGAGKSTLLKILSKITPPSSGKIISRGRIASLLEVGTGFHPELTGKENIFLNASILGMKRREVIGKFDEIVDFSGTERFLDTPLKHYSSGMQMRLAFSVAAFLEPEILIIDEVLAVGDMEFQKKCLGKMEDVSKSGRTILFVSHQMGMINSLCEKAVLLDKGEIHMIGKAKDVIIGYNDLNAKENQTFELKTEPIEKDLFLTQAGMFKENKEPCSAFGFDEQMVLQLRYKVKHAVKNAVLGFQVKDQFGRVVFTSQTELDKQAEPLVNGKEFLVNVRFPKSLLSPNHYSILCAIHIPNVRIIDRIENICVFNVMETGSLMAMYEGTDYGCVLAPCNWETKMDTSNESVNHP